jgi:hypothetical protein
MIDSSTTSPMIENLLAGLLAGELTDQQSAQFARLLATNAEALDQYLRLIFVTGLLHESRQCSTDRSENTARTLGVTATDLTNHPEDIYGSSSRWRGQIFRLGRRLLRAG